MGLQAQAEIFGQDFRDTSSVKQNRIGQKGETLDGRAYRYSLVGGVTLDPGKICVAETVDTDATNRTVARTYVAGVTEVIVDAAGAVAANRYTDGYLSITDATGEGGASYLVESNTVTSGAAEMTVVLAEPTEVALTIDVSEASLTANPWSGVLVSIADQLDMAVGIPNVSITNAEYGWLQTRGVVAALADESYAIGQELVIGSSVVGALEAHDAAGQQTVGVAIVAGVDTEYREVYLNID